jgi:hypothetical protein
MYSPAQFAGLPAVVAASSLALVEIGDVPSARWKRMNSPLEKRKVHLRGL